MPFAAFSLSLMSDAAFAAAMPLITYFDIFILLLFSLIRLRHLLFAMFCCLLVWLIYVAALAFAIISLFYAATIYTFQIRFAFVTPIFRH